MTARTAALTALAMLAFAANSLLCRLALEAGQIDPASFASIRLLAGVVALVGLSVLLRRGSPSLAANWRAAFALFTYVVFFTFAYVSLGAATGALILFGAVQLTMFAFALRAGERVAPLAWLGSAVAVCGLIYLVSPGLTAPNPAGALLMAVAGAAWGVYSLLGKGAADPVAATTSNFLHAAPLALIVSLFSLPNMQISSAGVALAVASGALASGCGYAVWYAALPGLSAARAATVQLSVPVIAAFGGAVMLAEPITARLVLASVATLGGVALVLTQRTAK